MVSSCLRRKWRTFSFGVNWLQSPFCFASELGGQIPRSAPASSPGATLNFKNCPQLQHLNTLCVVPEKNYFIVAGKKRSSAKISVVRYSQMEKYLLLTIDVGKSVNWVSNQSESEQNRLGQRWNHPETLSATNHSDRQVQRQKNGFS